MSDFSHTPTNLDRAGIVCASRPGPGAGLFSESDFGLIAARMRLFSHPVRLRILHALHEQDGTLDSLAAQTRCSVTTVRSHVGVLHRTGVVCRTDTSGPAVFGLVDWADWWLVAQYAARLREAAASRGCPGGGRA